MINITPNMPHIHTLPRPEQDDIFDRAWQANNGGDSSLIDILKQRALDAVRDGAQKAPEEGFGLPETEYTRTVREFPPAVQKIASLFFNTFMIPLPAIPKPSKSKTSKYKRWIKELEYLNKLGGKYSSRAMPMAFKTKQSGALTIADPAAINKIFQDAISEILAQEKQMKAAKMVSDEKKSETIVHPDADKLRKMRHKFS